MIENIEVVNLVRANLNESYESYDLRKAIKYHSINPLNLDSIKDEFSRHELPEILRLNKNEFIYDVGKYYRHQIKQIYSTANSSESQQYFNNVVKLNEILSKVFSYTIKRD